MRQSFYFSFIIIETLVAVTMVVEQNWWAAAGWGMYALSNISILLQDVKSNNKNQTKL